MPITQHNKILNNWHPIMDWIAPPPNWYVEVLWFLFFVNIVSYFDAFLVLNQSGMNLVMMYYCFYMLLGLTC